MESLRRLLAFFLFISTATSFAQRLVTGRLIDKETGSPIKEAIIKLIGSEIITTVNDLGFFQLQIDSLDEIAIMSQEFDTLILRLPGINIFKVEIIKTPRLSPAIVANESLRIYLDEHRFPSEKARARTYRIISTHPNLPDKYLAEEYDLKGNLRSIGTFSDFKMYINDGYFAIFHSNGKKAEEGFYKDNHKIGQWKKWYSNGNIKEESSYDDSEDYNHRLRIYTFFDSLGFGLVTNGQGQYIIDDEEPVRYSKGAIKDGKKSGKWIGYLKSGEIAYEEDFENGELRSGRSYDALRREYKYDKIGEMDRKSWNPFFEFIMKNLNYPRAAMINGIQGKVFVTIAVNTNGQIKKARVASGIGGGCDEEALRVIKKYNGKVGFSIKRGQIEKFAKWQIMTVPISFKID